MPLQDKRNVPTKPLMEEPNLELHHKHYPIPVSSSSNSWGMFAHPMSWLWVSFSPLSSPERQENPCSLRGARADLLLALVSQTRKKVKRVFFMIDWVCDTLAVPPPACTPALEELLVLRENRASLLEWWSARNSHSEFWERMPDLSIAAISKGVALSFILSTFNKSP